MLCCFQFVWGIKMDILLGRIISWKLHSHPPSWRRDPVTFKKLLVLKSISLCNILPYYLKNVLVFIQVIFSKTATKVLKILRWYLAISSPPWLNSFPYCIVPHFDDTHRQTQSGKHSIAFTKLIPDHCQYYVDIYLKRPFARLVNDTFIQMARTSDILRADVRKRGIQTHRLCIVSFHTLIR